MELSCHSAGALFSHRGSQAVPSVIPPAHGRVAGEPQPHVTFTPAPLLPPPQPSLASIPRHNPYPDSSFVTSQNRKGQPSVSLPSCVGAKLGANKAVGYMSLTKV